ncbi:phenylalanyl-tRNA synthetase [Rickenella mellea]|uniref:Phenylalanine--tRNA ligase, mitochondrial n=1 Tax=Rickenella mellea TaxID=50990 RepID=A0A4Y7QIM0_9AGAM|nr:phenylalanyl-tRNA synthetase [Rickenella mellea]
MLRPPWVVLRTYATDDHTNITPAIISKLGIQLHSQPGHPLTTVKNLVESQFSDYAHLSSFSPLVTPAKNFDELSFPPDHPGRAVTDSYYVNRGLMLRTHTSAHEVEVFAQGHDKWLLTADVYRRDEIDASHFPVFHQMEGARLFPTGSRGLQELKKDNAILEKALSLENIKIEDNTSITPENPYQDVHDPYEAQAVTTNLKLSLNALMLRLFAGAGGISRQNPLHVRWIEAFFPFTSPSYEVEVFFQGKWLEILGCGVVRHSTLDRANIHGKIGWAFGLGLERIAMILYSIPDIRLFWSNDARFLSQFTPGKISTFQPYSKYPPCYKDVSFWLPPTGLHDNDVCDLVRVVAEDFAENVERTDSFSHPKTKRNSVCYRINYRSLSNAEANEIHSRVKSRLVEQFGVEIR